MIQTASDFLDENYFDIANQIEYLPSVRSAKDLRENVDFTINDIYSVMVEFAKTHVKSALEAASRKATANVVNRRYGMREWTETELDYYSIINAYPLDNIK